LKTQDLGVPVSVTADIEGVDSMNRILVGGKSGVYLLDRETGELELLKRFYETGERNQRLRNNDGAVGSSGEVLGWDNE
jgi:hypothetical protein